MRQIDFQPETPVAEASNLIWAHMQYPKNADRAFELFAKLHLRESALFETPNTNAFSLPASWVKALVLGPSLKELKRGGEIRNREGLSAGLVLWNAFLYEQQPDKQISLNKAIEIVMRVAELKNFRVLGAKPYPNKAEIHKSWKSMRDVAHLWAGLILAELQISQGHLNPSLEALQRAMGFAKALADWGCSCQVAVAGGAKGTLLDPASLLHLPPFIAPLTLSPIAIENLPEFVTAPIGKR